VLTNSSSSHTPAIHFILYLHYLSSIGLYCTQLATMSIDNSFPDSFDEFCEILQSAIKTILIFTSYSACFFVIAVIVMAFFMAFAVVLVKSANYLGRSGLVSL